MPFYFPQKPTRISIESALFKSCEANPNYVAQKKKDGWRVQIIKENNKLTLLTRHNKLLVPMVNDVDWKEVTAELLKGIKPKQCILDGEFLHRRTELKETFYVWDMFEYEGRRLNMPYRGRKELLNESIDPKALLSVLQDYTTNFQELWDSLNPKVDEGLVIKDLTEQLNVNFKKTTKSPRQFKILLNDPRNLLGDKND